MSAIEPDSDGRIGVAASTLVDATREFTRIYSGEEHTGLQIITLAIMHGIEVGYKAGLERRTDG